MKHLELTSSPAVQFSAGSVRPCPPSHVRSRPAVLQSELIACSTHESLRRRPRLTGTNSGFGCNEQNFVLTLCCRTRSSDGLESGGARRQIHLLARHTGGERKEAALNRNYNVTIHLSVLSIYLGYRVAMHWDAMPFHRTGTRNKQPTAQKKCKSPPRQPVEFEELRSHSHF